MSGPKLGSRVADDGFDTRFGHFLNGYTFDVLVFECLQNFTVSLAHVFRRGQIEFDAARVRFVNNVRRNYFQHDGKSDFSAHGQRFVLRVGYQKACGCNAHTFEDFLCLMFHQVTAILLDRLMDNFGQLVFQ
jgi:hypothetical protein